MSTIPSRGHSGEHRQNAGRVKADFLQIRAQIRDQIPICGEWVQSQLSSKLNFCQLWLSEGQMGQAFARQGPKVARQDAQGADQIWQSRFEVPRQISREGALIVALGLIGAIVNQCAQQPLGSC